MRMSAYLHMMKAKAGDADSMNTLALNYYWGNGGVKKDYREALMWFDKAAAKGHREALFNLGGLYEHGYGTPINLPNALNCYKLAKDQGFDFARHDKDAIARVEVAIAAAGGVTAGSTLPPTGLTAPLPPRIAAVSHTPRAASTTSVSTAPPRPASATPVSNAPPVEVQQRAADSGSSLYEQENPSPVAKKVAAKVH